MKTSPPALAIALLFSLVRIAGAQTTATWSLAGDGTWKNAANWSSPSYPDNGQPAPGDTYNTVLNTNRIITLDGSVAIQGLTQSTGTITGAADKTLTLAGPLAWTGGILTGGMTVQLNGSSTFSSSSNRELTGGTIFNNAGTMSWTAGNIGNNIGNFTFNNQAAGVMNISPASDQAIGALNGSKVFNNAGSIVKTGAPYVDFQLPTHNSGSIDLQQGKIEWRGGSNTGSVTVAAGAELRIPTASSFTQSGSGSLTGAGSVTFYSSSAPSNFNAGTYNVASTNAWAGDLYFNIPAQTGTLHLGNPFNQPGARLFGNSSLTVSGLMTWNGNGGWPNDNTGILGSLQVHAQGGITMDGNAKPLDGNSQLHNYATATWSSGSIGHANWFGSGTASWIVNRSGATFLMSGPGNIDGDHTVSRFSNSGVFTRNGAASEAHINSRFINNATGILNLNTGSLKMIFLINNGTVNVNSGTLWMQEGGSATGDWQNGAFHFATGTTLRVGSNSAINFGPTSSINGSGGLRVTGGSPTFQSGMTLQLGGPVSIEGGTGTFGVNATFPELALTGGSLAGPGNLSVPGSMNWGSGNLGGHTTPSTLNAEGGLTISGGFRYFTGRLLRNHDGALWSSGEISAGSGAVFENLAGATFATNFGGTFSHSGGTNPVFLNQGEFVKTNGTTTFGNNTTFNNEGSVSIQSGTLAASHNLTNSGTIALEGGNLSATGTFSNSGIVSGSGLITGRPANTGTVRAEGGELTVSNGVAGPGGNVETTAGSSLVLNGAASSANSLSHSGAGLSLASNFTVHGNYQNATFGSGNAFNPRANVSGAGQILAGGTTGQNVAGSHVTGGASATPTLSLGTLRQGQSVSRSFTIHNPGASGPLLRGALQTSANGGNITDARLAGSGVSAGSFDVAANSSTAAFTVDFNATSGGPLTGQQIRLANNFDNVADQTLTLSGGVWGLAQPQITSATPIEFGNVRIGKMLPHVPVVIKNNAPADGWHEGLTVAPLFSDVEPAGPSEINALPPQATDNTTIALRIPTNTAGPVNGQALLEFGSDGTGTSGLSPTIPVSSNTIAVTGTVHALAAPTLLADSHDFGAVRVGDTPPPFALDLSNAAGPYREGLNAAFAPLTVPAGYQVSGSVANLAPGASSTALEITMDTTTSGPRKSEALRVNLASDGVATGESAFDFSQAKISLTGSVWRPAIPVIPGAPTVHLGNVRVGTTGALYVPVRNGAPDDGFSEEMMAEFLTATGGDFTFSEIVKYLPPQQLNSSGLKVAFNTATPGPRSGPAEIRFASNGDNTSGIPDELGLGSQNVNLSAGVYRPAVGEAGDQIIGYVRKAETDTVTGNIEIKNLAEADGYSERLIARITGVSSNLLVVDGESLLADPEGGDASMSVTMTHLARAEIGLATETATLAYATTGGGIPANSGLPEAPAGGQTIDVMVQVNSPARALLTKVSGPATFAYNEFNYTGGGNFATVNSANGPQTLAIELKNGTPVNFMDNLKATFDTTALGPFTLVPPVSYPAGGLLSGNSRNFSITLDPTALPAGPVSGTLVIHQVSSNPTSDLTLTPITLTFVADVYVPSPYETWVAENALVGNDALPGSDPDGDRHDNYTEFAFGGDPKNAAHGPVMVTRVLEGVNGKFLAVLARVRKGNESPFVSSNDIPPLDRPSRATRDGVVYAALAATTPGAAMDGINPLIPGNLLQVIPLDPPLGFDDIPPPASALYQDVVFRLTATLNGQSKAFFRMSAQPVPAPGG